MNKRRGIDSHVPIQVLTPEMQSEFNFMEQIMAAPTDEWRMQRLSQAYCDLKDKFIAMRYSFLVKQRIIRSLSRERSEYREKFYDIVKRFQQKEGEPAGSPGDEKI